MADPAQRRGDRAASLRDRRRTRTKYLVQTEALRLFVQKGYAQTTIEDIAHAAAMSPRTFFRYFPSKEDVVLWDEYDEPPFSERIWLPPLSGDPIAHSVAYVRKILCDTCLADPERLLTRVKICYTHPDIWAGYVVRQSAAFRRAFQNFAKSWGTDPDDLRMRVLVSAIFAAVIVVVDRWQRCDGTADLGQLYDEAIAALADSSEHLRATFVAAPILDGDALDAVRDRPAS